MRRTKIEALKTREHLMAAALETFYTKGVSRSSLNEIAQAAGVTRGALYWHFKNKEDLFDALFQRLCDDIDSRLRGDLADESADMLESLRISLLNMFFRLENNPLHFKFCNILSLKCEHTDKNQAIMAVIEKYHNMWYELLTAVLTQCVKQKSLPENLDITAAVIYLKSVTGGLIDQWLLNPERINLGEAAPRLMETVFGGLKSCPALRLRA